MIYLRICAPDRTRTDTGRILSQLLLHLVSPRTLRFNCGYLLGQFAFDAGDGGFLKIRSSYCFFI